MRSNDDEKLHILEVYKSRYLALKQDPLGGKEDLLFYEREIDLLIGELAFIELMERMKGPKVRVMTTDCWQTVDDMCREEKVIFMKMKFSWRQFKFIWHVEYITPRK